MIDIFLPNTSVDWNDITNKPTTFPPSPHTHSINDIFDFPPGNVGDVFIHNGVKWNAENIVEYYSLSLFKASQNIVFPKNKILCLQGSTFYKITDGVTQLGQLPWRNNGININGQNINVNGELYYRYDSVTNNYLASNIKKQSITTSVQTINLDANALRGQYIILKQPSTLNYVGINVTSVFGSFSANLVFLVYSVNFATQTATRIAFSNPIAISSVGQHRNLIPFNLDLPPNVYLIAYASQIISGNAVIQAIYTENTEFQQHRLLTEPFPQYLQTNLASFASPVNLSSPPTTINLVGVTNAQTTPLMFYWFNPIN